MLLKCKWTSPYAPKTGTPACEVNGVVRFGVLSLSLFFFFLKAGWRHAYSEDCDRLLGSDVQGRMGAFVQFDDRRKILRMESNRRDSVFLSKWEMLN